MNTSPAPTHKPDQMHRSVPLEQKGHWFRHFLAIAGPGYLVSVGYMDPGNWATDLAGGAQFGYALIWVILVSNLMAILLQSLCVKLGIATGRDLAQACRDYYSKPTSIALWLLCEVAIIACDLAEVIGSAVALNMLFKIPLLIGVLITGMDVLMLLGLMHFGFRKLEALVVVLVATIGGCFAVELFLSRPDMMGVLGGTFVPTIPSKDAFYIAIGILGATVMPHNLYLHSALVQTRAVADNDVARKRAITHNLWDTVIALSAAFFVNASILVVSAAVFNRAGNHSVEELGEAHRLLAPLLGTTIASTLFAVALLVSGQSSTITGTLAGQIVMEGFLRIRIRPWLRRLITRALAIIPAVIMLVSTGSKGTVKMLILSQVVLSLQLPFAIFPLLSFTSDRQKMGSFVNGPWLKYVGYTVCYIIAGLNIYLLYQEIGRLGSLLTLAAVGGFAAWVRFGYRAPQTATAGPRH